MMYPALRTVRSRLRRALAAYALGAAASLSACGAAFMGYLLVAGILTLASFAAFNIAYSMAKMPFSRSLVLESMKPRILPVALAGWSLGAIAAAASMLAFLASAPQGIIVLANAVLMLAYTSLIYFEVSG